MRYTIRIHGQPEAATVESQPGRVVFNGRDLLPFEAAMLADALSECADSAETKAAQVAANLKAA